MKPELACNSSIFESTTIAGRGSHLTLHPSPIASNEMNGGTSMYLHIRKEVRCILPYWLLGLGAILGVRMLPSSMEWLLRLAIPPSFAVMTLLLGAAPFGSEFHYRTMPLLLLQPLDRALLWRLKMIVLGIALLSLVAAVALMPANLYPTPHYPFRYPAIAIYIFAMAPWLTLIARDGLIGAALTFVSVGVLEFIPVDSLAFGFAVLITVGVIGCYFGRLAFMRWEFSPPRRLRLPRMGSGFARPAAMALPQARTQSALGALAWKEFCLQKISICLALVFCLGFIMTTAMIHVLPERGYMLKQFVQFYCAALPVLVGAVSVAGEGHLGLLEWHLSLPVSVVRQFLLKMSVCLTLGLGAGFLLPYALLRVRGALPEWFPVPLVLLLVLIGVTIGICASSLQTGTLRAAIVGWVGFIVAVFASLWLHNAFIDLGIFTWFHSGPSLLCNRFTACTVMALALAALFRLAFDCYCHPPTVRRPKWIVPIMVTLIGVLLAAGLLVCHEANAGDVF